MKKNYSLLLILFTICIFLFWADKKNEDYRPHGSQNELPELTRNNYLIGNLNENRSSYRVSFYDINIDFDTKNKSLNGFVTIKAKSLSDLNRLQIDLAETLNIKKITYKDEVLSFVRDLDAVLISFPSVIRKNNIFEFTIFYNGIPQNADNPPWAGGFTWSQDKNGRDWIAVSCEGEGARIWWPNKDHITAEGDSVRMVYTVPSDMVAIGNGSLRSINNKGEKTSYEWFVNNPINNPVCNRASIAPKAPPEEMPSRCGSASWFRVTACRLAPTRARPAPTIIASSALGNRMSQTIASLPWLQVCSRTPGEILFSRTLQTVAVGTATAPTDTAIESDMMRTMVNVCSDTVGTVIIAKSEGETVVYK